MGDDQPRPAMSRFHATFSVADQRSGIRASLGDAAGAGASKLRPVFLRHKVHAKTKRQQPKGDGCGNRLRSLHGSLLS